MAKISLAGFKDPARRPRYLIWTGVAVLFLAVFVVVAFGATSTYWFCAEICHKVQDDAIAAYDRSSHSMVSCMSCHEPVNADPITFTLKKAKALGELVLTVTNNYELPLNASSHLSMNAEEMGSGQCTQCHSENRKITPSAGIVINHGVHADKDVHCTACHNRVAHNESGDWEPELTDPKSKQVAHKHQNFMTMTACFRCHTLTDQPPAGGIRAPGQCSACHPANFDLKPANHDAPGFFPAGHADLAIAELDPNTGRPSLEATGAAEAEESEETTGAAEEATGAAEGEEGEEAEEEEGPGLNLVALDEVDYCSTCHLKAKFCMDCHGMEMPHPEEFKVKTHPAVAQAKLDKCEMCHQQSKTFFCDSCHHGSKVGWTFDPKVAWQTQHAKTVVEKGVTGCLGACHEQKFCVDCHTKKQPLPTSHKAADWLHKGLTVTIYPDTPAAPTASHAVNALKSTESCDVCHGPGGIGAAFCKNCHQIDMPHPDTFKKTHVSGRKTMALCANCHKAKELCSDCHHQGAVNGTPWQRQHPVTVAKSGANPCFEKCHQDKKFCVDCHTKLKALPTSHKAADWTKRTALDQPAKHQVAYKAATDSCDYCHGDGGVKAAFCVSCHKLDMPHPSGFKDQHKADFEAGKYTKPVCMNCHVQYFCDSCHHTGAVTTQAWRTYHPSIVKKDGAEPCFKCHEPTFCSYCHVRL